MLEACRRCHGGWRRRPRLGPQNFFKFRQDKTLRNFNINFGLWAFLGLSVLFSVSYGYIVYASYIAAPYFDNWGMFILDRFFWQKFILHNEHIINFIAFTYWVDNNLFHGLGFLQLGLTAAMFAALGYVFVSATSPFSSPGKFGLCALLFAACLSGTQFTNITWSFQVGFVGAFFFGALSIWCAARAPQSETPGRWVALSLILSGTAGICIAAGVLVLPVLAFFLSLLRLPPRLKLAASFCALIVFFVLLAANPPDSHNSSLAARSLLDAAVFSMAVLGSLAGAACDLRWLGFSPGVVSPPVIAAVAGVILVAAASVMTLAALWAMIEERMKVESLWPLFIAAWTGGVALATGFGRSGMPVAEAISSRYVTVSVLFACSLLILADRIWPWLFNRRLPGAACWLAAVLLMFSQVDRMAQAEVAGRRFEEAESALMNSAVNAPEMLSIYFSPPDIAYIIPLIKTRRLSIFAKPAAALLGANLDEGGFQPAGDCPAVLQENVRGPGRTRIAGTYNRRLTPFRPDAVALLGSSSTVEAAGVVRKRMLGLRPGKIHRGFVLISDGGVAPASAAASLVLISLAKKSYCKAAAL